VIFEGRRPKEHGRDSAIIKGKEVIAKPKDTRYLINAYFSRLHLICSSQPLLEDSLITPIRLAICSSTSPESMFQSIIVKQRLPLTVFTDVLSLVSHIKRLSEKAWDRDEESKDEQQAHDDEGEYPLECNDMSKELSNPKS
jgi:hypothetical protein